MSSRHGALSKQLNERVYLMKSIKTFVAVIALATSFGSFAAQTVTASASTLDGAEAKIA
ncbi:YdgH/BhsA/McbA-like domain containing protein, partial [Enterobacter hormaechei]